MLTTTEQDDLYTSIAAFLGDTIRIVEDMFSSNAKCNQVMKELIVDFLSSGA